MAMQTYEEAMKSDMQDMVVEIGDVQYKGTFSNIRIDRKTLPEGYHAYDLRHSDDGDIFFNELKNGYIWVNHSGTFVCDKELPIEENDSVFYGDDISIYLV